MNSLYYTFPKGFSIEECELIKQFTSEMPRSIAQVYQPSGVGINLNQRRSEIVWIPKDGRMQWIYDRLTLLALEANEHSFHLRLDNYPRLSFGNAQYTEYRDTNNGTFDWHRDTPQTESDMMKSVRKLTICVQLSDSSEYSGGSFELEEVNTPLNQSIGNAIAFPSHLKHRVTPVTEGIRKSLVLWIFGPQLT